MGTITLDDRDRAVLASLGRDGTSIESLADSVDCSPADLRDRLPELADNDLARRVDDDTYAITDSGRRALVGSPGGTLDQRIDTPAAVEEQIRSFDLPPDREEALRNAFAFLAYWRNATAAEIIDGIYSENPAGFESPMAWWDDFVRERLAALPLVKPPEPPEATEVQWRYTDTSGVESDPVDGRLVAGDEAQSGSSVRNVLEQSDLDEGERVAVRAAFDHLAREGEVTATDFEERVYPEFSAGYDSAAEWWTDSIEPAFEQFPGVEPSADTEDRWEYRQLTD